MVDQLSVCVPILRWFAQTRVVFYCHFPDKFLAGGREDEIELAAGRNSQSTTTTRNRNRNRNRGRRSLWKRIYRLPFDALEEVTTGQADVILANSAFTRKVFTAAFPTLRNNKNPRIVYPCINLKNYEAVPLDSLREKKGVKDIESDRPTFVSLNRFERKKNVALAIESFRIYKDEKQLDRVGKQPRLVIAGGYDDKLPDNIETLQALRDLCEKYELSHVILNSISSSTPPNDPSTGSHLNTVIDSNIDVLFLLNFNTDQRTYLLQTSLALLYTPENEHFGIVPVEAMACGLPVLAVNSGGPTETVIDGVTGFLRPPVANIWAECLIQITKKDENVKAKMGEAGRERAKSFGIDVLGQQLEEACVDAVDMGAVGPEENMLLFLGAGGIGFFMLFFVALFQLPPSVI